MLSVKMRLITSSTVITSNHVGPAAHINCKQDEIMQCARHTDALDSILQRQCSCSQPSQGSAAGGWDHKEFEPDQGLKSHQWNEGIEGPEP